MDKYVTVPAGADELKNLRAGDYVYLTGTIYTARDAAHKRLYEAAEEKKELPVNLKNQIVYYLGPTPAREGQVIGSAGPTTSSRMDKYTPRMLSLGLKGMIGKGKRSEDVIESMKENGAVYFAAVGGGQEHFCQSVSKNLRSLRMKTWEQRQFGSLKLRIFR